MPSPTAPYCWGVATATTTSLVLNVGMNTRGWLGEAYTEMTRLFATSSTTTSPLGMLPATKLPEPVRVPQYCTNTLVPDCTTPATFTVTLPFIATFPLSAANGIDIFRWLFR